MFVNSKRAGTLLLALVFAALIALSSLAVAGATAEEDEDEVVSEKKALICHRDNNVKQPYGPKAKSVSINSVNGLGKNDHLGTHTGPIATSQEVAEALKLADTKWGDIIPPLSGTSKIKNVETPWSHDGLNWDKWGQAMFENDCQFVEEVTPLEVKFVAPTCDALGTYTIPTTKGVEYRVDGVAKAAGTYTSANGSTVKVTAVALKGYVLEGVSEWPYTFTAPTNCDEGQPVVVPETPVTPPTVTPVATPATTPTALPSTGTAENITAAAITGIASILALISVAAKSAFIRF